jgi:RNA polymerase sigma-70 factor (ECF subfamily)
MQASDAEDVRQMTMMRLVRTLPRFAYDPARGRFRDYLYRVVRSATGDVVGRPSGRPAAVDMDMDVLAGAEAPDGLWEQEWVDHHYRLAMTTVRATIEPRSVQAFERLLGGQTVEAVAESMGMTTDGVHKLKQRMRDRLRALIEAQVREEDDADG